MTQAQKPWRKPRKRGPVPPKGGRIRVTINLPKTLIGSVDLLYGKSRSDKIVQALKTLFDR